MDHLVTKQRFLQQILQFLIWAQWKMKKTFNKDLELALAPAIKKKKIIFNYDF